MNILKDTDNVNIYIYKVKVIEMKDTIDKSTCPTIFEDGGVTDEISDIDALKNFILDIECLDQLSEWTNRFNLFDILKISRTEIRHSNMLAWLLDPEENHGLGDEVIRRFIQYSVTAFSNYRDLFGILLKDFDTFNILREYHHIDILAVSEKEKIVLCIENKIDSSEHDNQLVRYRKAVENLYKDYHKLYIFLSPEGEEPSDDNWCSMSYQDVLNIVECSKQKHTLIPEAEILIENYVESIRRYIVGDEKLVQICSEIYKKHKKAIDLIIENKPDKASEIAEIIKSWALEKNDKGEIDLVLDKCSKSHIRFKTEKMSEYLPDADEALSGWSTKNNYFYEIINDNGNEFHIQFALSSKNLSNELREKCDIIYNLYPSKQHKTNWQWRICKRTRAKKIDADYAVETIRKQLDEQLNEMKNFEKDLFEKIKN